MAFGTDPTPDGLADPPIDDLMKHADSKYALAIYAAVAPSPTAVETWRRGFLRQSPAAKMPETDVFVSSPANI